MRRVFCPPKELYEGKRVESDPKGRVLAPFDELIEEGKIIGLNFPVALNPALAKTIGTMMKIDYQRAVQLRIPRMEAETDRHFRPTVFICDEYPELRHRRRRQPSWRRALLFHLSSAEVHSHRCHAEREFAEGSVAERGFQDADADLSDEDLSDDLRSRHGAVSRRKSAARRTRRRSATPSPNPATMPKSAGSAGARHRTREAYRPPSTTRNPRSRSSRNVLSSSSRMRKSIVVAIRWNPSACQPPTAISSRTSCRRT